MQVPQDLDARYCLLKYLLSFIVFLLILAPGVVSADYTEVEWLARNIYHEARGEGLQGKIAVAIVTINRVESGTYPNTIRGVITQSDQFSWYHKKKIKAIKKNDNYGLCLLVSRATIALWRSKKVEHFIRQTGINKVKWYHKDTIKPYWIYKKVKIVKIGKHILYKDT